MSKGAGESIGNALPYKRCDVTGQPVKRLRFTGRLRASGFSTCDIRLVPHLYVNTAGKIQDAIAVCLSGFLVVRRDGRKNRGGKLVRRHRATGCPAFLPRKIPAKPPRALRFLPLAADSAHGVQVVILVRVYEHRISHVALHLNKRIGGQKRRFCRFYNVRVELIGRTGTILLFGAGILVVAYFLGSEGSRDEIVDGFVLLFNKRVFALDQLVAGERFAGFELYVSFFIVDHDAVGAHLDLVFFRGALDTKNIYLERVI